MKFTIDDIAVYDDVCPPELLIQVLEIMKARGFNFGWHSSKREEFSHWNLNFGGSKKERYDAYDKLPAPVQMIWDELRSNGAILRGNYRVIRSYVNAMVYGTEGYIHTDSQVETDLSICIYLNPEWHPEWAGEVVCFDQDGEIVKAVLPRFGRAVIFPGAMEHAARGVSRICPEARYVLVFKAASD